MVDVLAMLTLSIIVFGVMPSILILSFVTIVIQYFIAKTWLLKWHKTPNMLSPDLIISFTKFLTFAIWLSVTTVLLFGDEYSNHGTNEMMMIKYYWVFFTVITILPI